MTLTVCTFCVGDKKCIPPSSCCYSSSSSSSLSPYKMLNGTFEEDEAGIVNNEETESCNSNNTSRTISDNSSNKDDENHIGRTNYERKQLIDMNNNNEALLFGLPKCNHQN
jgi:hypothetical protein